MDTPLVHTDQLSEDPISITEAAQKIGVSERTVYRMLKSGKLTRVIVSDKLIGVDLSAQNISRKTRNSALVDVIDEDSLSDRLKVEIKLKDEEIRHLVSVQQELHQTIFRQQELIMEFTRLILIQQNQGRDNKVQEKPTHSHENSRRRGLSWKYFFRKE